MGCFNLTDALTNLPIREGDEVMIIPILKTEYGHNDEYNLIPIIIEGTYDDYGWINNVIRKDDIEISTENIRDCERDNIKFLNRDLRFLMFHKDTFYTILKKSNINTIGILIKKLMCDLSWDMYNKYIKDKSILNLKDATNVSKLHFVFSNIGRIITLPCSIGQSTDVTIQKIIANITIEKANEITKTRLIEEEEMS
jgi:hypothetical protein